MTRRRNATKTLGPTRIAAYAVFLVLHVCLAASVFAVEGLPGLSVEERAVARVNRYRESLGLVPVGLHEALTRAARSHARYLLRNEGRGHVEDPALPGFTGVHPWDRTAAVGYPFPGIWEDVHYLGDPVASVDGWIDSVYHRIPILQPNLREVGYGLSGRDSQAYDVMKFAVGDGDRPHYGSRYGDEQSGNEARAWTVSTAERDAELVLYPRPDQFGVPTSFAGESPNPRPDGADRSGYPVTAILSEQAASGGFEVADARIVDGSGVPLDIWVRHPGNDANLRATVALIPKDLLSLHERYTVKLALQLNGGRSVRRVWSFTTGPDRSVGFVHIDSTELEGYQAQLAHIRRLERASFLSYLSRLVDLRAFFSTGSVDPLWDRARDLGRVNHSWTQSTTWTAAERRTVFVDETEGARYEFVEIYDDRRVNVRWVDVELEIRPDGVVYKNDGGEVLSRSLPDLIAGLEIP